MAVSRYKKEQQTRLFAQRTYDRQKDKGLVTKNTEKLIDQAIKDGKTPNDLKQIFQMEAQKAENYARTAARTDATRLENVARGDAYNQIADMGVIIIKIWQTIMDGAERPSHHAINGEEQFPDDEFSIGGQYPGDPDLPGEERYNCRCRTLPQVLGLEKLSDADKDKFIEKIQGLNVRILKGLGY